MQQKWTNFQYVYLIFLFLEYCLKPSWNTATIISEIIAKLKEYFAKWLFWEFSSSKWKKKNPINSSFCEVSKMDFQTCV